MTFPWPIGNDKFCLVNTCSVLANFPQKPPKGIVIKNAVDKFCFECKGSPEVKYWVRYGWCSVVKGFNDEGESCFNKITMRNEKLQGQLNNHRTLINPQVKVVGARPNKI